MKKLKFLLPLSLSLIACTDCANRSRPDPTPARKPPGPSRVLAIGDVHGDLDSFKRILKRADLIDQDSNWIGGRAVLVQTGDLLDRGKDIRLLVELLMKLQEQAPTQGGKVIVVMGNHEGMHLAGDFNYVGLKAYAAFVDQDSQSRRDRAFADWAKSAGQDTGPENRKRWMNLHPLGSLEYQEAFGPRGRYGKWLRTLPVIAQVQDTVFLHGGISPDYTVDLAQLNRQARQQIGQLTPGKPGQSWKSLGGILFSDSGPLWFRGVALWEESRLSYLTSWLGPRRLVAGHTPNPKAQIQTRLSGRVWLIDTGMASEFFPGGQASALELDEGKITAIYTDRYQVLAESDTVSRPWPGLDGKALPFSSHSQALDFLRSARVVSSEEYKDGVNLNHLLVLEKEGRRARAIFRFEHNVEEKPFTIALGRKFHFRDSYNGEVAAYQLARLLGIHNLPPAVERTVAGRPGSVQLWLEGTRTEHQRQIQELTPPDQESWDRQVGDMRIFDNLINNTDRHPKNMLIDQQWNLWMIDHTRSLGKDHYLPLPLTLKRCSARLRRALRRLDEKEVRLRLQAHLSTGELDALLARHAKLLEVLSRPLKTQPAGRLSPEPMAYSGQPAIDGSLTQDEVQAVIRTNIQQISKCHQQVLKPSPSLASKVVVDFTIDSEGKVANARVSMTSLSDPQVENCMLKKISGWTFPPPDKGSVKVSYPFVFMMH